MSRGSAGDHSSDAKKAELYGFVCPECYVSLSSSEELMSHFSSHQIPIMKNTDPTFSHPSSDAGVESHTQLLKEMSQHNKILLEQLSSNTQHIFELETALGILMGDPPGNPEFRFSDEELKHKVTTALEKQTNVVTVESQLEMIRQELHTANSALEASEARYAELLAKHSNVSRSDMECQTEGIAEESPELIAARTRISELTIELDQALTSRKLCEHPAIDDSNGISVDKRAQIQIVDLTDRLRALEIERDQSNSQYECRINDLIAENAQLKCASDQHVQANTQLHSDLRILHDDLDQLKGRYEQIQRDKAELETQRSRERDEWMTEQSMITTQLTQVKHETASLRAIKENLEKECTRLTQELTYHQSLVHTTEEKLTEQLKATEQKLAQTQDQLQLSKKEVDSLLERLIAADDKCVNQAEQVQSQAQEIERLKKAIFELGRENQSLQMLRERITSRQWTKDDDVVYCSGCRSEFSLTNRKHHCRHCGGIFCQSCSSHRASIAASKDPVRVCGPCYADLTGTGAH